MSHSTRSKASASAPTAVLPAQTKKAEQAPIEGFFPTKVPLVSKGVEFKSETVVKLIDSKDASNWMKSRAPKELSQLWRRCAVIPGEGGRNEPLYGEINCGGIHRIFAYLKAECNFTSDSVFMDIGHGLGKIVYHAALDPCVKKSIGIEISDYRYQSSVWLKELLQKKYDYPLDNVKLIHGDITSMHKFEATHVYAFFPRMSPEAFPYCHIADVFMRSPASQYMICYTPPNKMAEYGYKVNTLTKLSVKQQGRGSSFTVYIYGKQQPDSDNNKTTTQAAPVDKK